MGDARARYAEATGSDVFEQRGGGHLLAGADSVSADRLVSFVIIRPDGRTDGMSDRRKTAAAVAARAGGRPLRGGGALRRSPSINNAACRATQTNRLLPAGGRVDIAQTGGDGSLVR